MTEATPRRTDEHKLRQAISDILEQTYAIEYAMGVFYRKGTEQELARANEDFEIMRGAVDRLGTLIADMPGSPTKRRLRRLPSRPCSAISAVCCVALP
jgi:hypothetical protein